MSSWARPGMRCVCIDGVKPNSWGWLKLKTGPQTGGVYTIAEIRKVWGEVVFVLEELPDVPGTGWEASHFRPLITRTQEQDLELFLPLLRPSPVDVGLVPAGVELDA